MAAGQLLDLSEAQRHYVQRVMRLGVGQTVLLFNGDGQEWPARITTLGPPLRVTLQQGVANHRESPLAITLVQGMARGQAMDWVVQKGVELGVARILPLVCQRGRHEGGNVERWLRIAAEAAEQCGRPRLPEIHAPRPWSGLPPLLDDAPRWLFWEEPQENATLTTLARATTKPTAITLFIGPEGGFSREEVTNAQHTLGCQVVGLGPRILRTETAALTAIAALQLLWGDLS